MNKENEWPQQVCESKWLPIDTLPKDLTRSIFLKDETKWTSGLVYPDGKFLDAKNEPGKEQIFFPTHWAHPHGLVIKDSEGTILVDGDGNEYR